MERLRGIELLVRATEAGSFAKAARSLNLTPSAVSHAVAALERELRVALFYRTTRKLQLTEEGEELYRRGRDILERLAEAETALSRATTRLSGTLRVGMGSAIGRIIVMPRLPEFIRRHPDVKLEYHAVSQITDIHAGGFDLLLRVGEPPDSGLIARKIADIHWTVYASPDYLKWAGEPLHPKELARHRCIVFKPEWATKALDEWTFERDGERVTVKVPTVLTSDDHGAMTTAALAGGGLIRAGLFDPASVATGSLKRLLTEWSCPGAPPIYVLYRRMPRMSPRVAAFIDFLTETFAAVDPEELTLVLAVRSSSSARAARLSRAR